MSALVLVNTVQANGTNSVVLDGIDTNDVYFFTGTGIKADGYVSYGWIRAWDGSAPVTTNYTNSQFAIRSDSADTVLTSVVDKLTYGWAWVMSAGTSVNVVGHLFNFYNATGWSWIKSHFVDVYNSTNALGVNSSSQITNAASYTGITFIADDPAVNITDGEFKLYRIKS